MRHPSLMPRVAIVDPVLTLSCSPDLTAHVGMDALCQVIEPYTSIAHNPTVDSLCEEGIVRLSRAIRTAVRDGANLAAREDMAIGATLGGMALANAKLGVVHGIASVLGGGQGESTKYKSPAHGAICACLLPHVFTKNVEKIGTFLPFIYTFIHTKLFSRVFIPIYYASILIVLLH